MINKKYAYVFFFSLLSIICNSQNTSLEKLKTAFGVNRINYLSANFPDSLAYYEFVAQDGFRITDKKYLKEDEIAKALPIDLPENDLKNDIPQPQFINIFTLPIQFHTTQNMYYRINGTEYVLVIRSKEYLSKKFNSKPK